MRLPIVPGAQPEGQNQQGDAEHQGAASKW
jgi:hypothetical protein